MSNFIFPKLASPAEFESLVRDIFRKITRNSNFQIYGRPWQSQFGIDSYGYSYTENRYIVVQCKNYTKEDDTADKVIKEIEKAVTLFDKWKLPFYDKVETFYFVTAFDRDTAFSNYTEEVNPKRIDDWKKPIEIMTWQDLTEVLTEHQDLLYKYYTSALPSEKQQNIFISQQSTDTKSYCLSDDIVSEAEPIIETIKNKIDFDIKFWINIDNYTTLRIWFHGFWWSIPFNNRVDLDFDLSSYFTSIDPDNWTKIQQYIEDVSSILARMHTEIRLTQVIVFQHLQPSLSILIWKILRRKNSGIEFIFQIMSDPVNPVNLTSSSHLLQYVPSELSEWKIFCNRKNLTNEDIVFMFNNTQPSISIESIIQKPIFQCINPSWGFSLFWQKLKSTSQWFSQSDVFIQKIQDIANWYNPTNIHVILICPEQFAALIGTRLKIVNSKVHLYYQNQDRSDYILAWILPTNS